MNVAGRFLFWACASLLALGAPHALAFDPCTFRGKKPRVEKYWQFKMDVTCKQGQPAKLHVYDFEGNELWQVEIKDKKLHGKSVVQVCAGKVCRRSAELAYRNGALDGEATLFHADGAKSTVRYKDGILDGPFTVKRAGQGQIVRGRFADGVLKGSTPADAFQASYVLADFGSVSNIYREIFDYNYFLGELGGTTFNRFGFVQSRRDTKDYISFNRGLIHMTTPFNGIGRIYDNGKLVEQVRFENGREVARRMMQPVGEWQKTEAPPKPRFSPNHLFLTLGAGYGTSGRFNADVAIIPMAIKDVGGGGFGVMASLYNDNDPYYIVSGVIGGIAMFFTGYASVGARFDDGEFFPDISAGVGFTGLMLYARVAPPQTTIGRPFELGLTVKVPILGL